MAKRFKYSDGDGKAVNRDDEQASDHIEICTDDSSVLENEAHAATIAFSNNNLDLLERMDRFEDWFHPFLRTDESAQFLSDQKVGSIELYGRRLPHPVSIPPTNGAAVVVQMQYPAVNKSPEYIDRGLVKIAELLPLASRTPARVFVNASVEMLMRIWPQNDGIDWQKSFATTVLLDLFPFQLPYLFKLKEFLRWLCGKNEAMFLLFQQIKKLQMEAVAKYLDETTVQCASGTPLLLAGTLSKASGKKGDYLYTDTVLCFLSTHCINHPCSFIDERLSPSRESILANQPQLDVFLSAVAGKDVKGTWFIKFADKNESSVRQVTEVRKAHGFGGIFESQEQKEKRKAHQFGSMTQSVAQVDGCSRGGLSRTPKGQGKTQNRKIPSVATEGYRFFCANGCKTKNNTINCQAGTPLGFVNQSQLNVHYEKVGCDKKGQLITSFFVPKKEP